MNDNLSVLPEYTIQDRIITMRNMQVMLDRYLAELYDVSTKVLNQAVKRNLQRFPDAFRFQLTENEKTEPVTNCDRFEKLKHSTTLPYAFTEQGVAMLLAVLRSDVAGKVHLETVDDFRVKFSENFRVKFNVKGNQMDRMTEMILRRSSGRLLVVKELAEEYGVSVRTIHEDLRRLEEWNIVTFWGPPKTGTYILTAYGKALLEDVV